MKYTLINTHGRQIIKQWLDSCHIDGSTPQRILDYSNDAETLKANCLRLKLVIPAEESRSGHYYVEALLIGEDCFTTETIFERE